MSKCKKLICLGVWVLIFGNKLIGQSIVEGFVIDNVNALPVIGATVSVNGSKTGTYSDSDGAFQLTIKQPLPVKISISFVGYELKELEIKEPVDNLLVSLVPGALVGQEIIISASRKKEKIQEAPSAIEIIKGDDLYIDGVNNAFLSLRKKSGLDVSQFGVEAGHITLRGRSAIFQTETFVMSDYRNLTLPGLGAIIYGQQPIDPIDIDKIEIVKGPGSVLYGPGVEAGIVHFLSKSPFSKQGTSVSFGVGNRNSFQASIRHAGVNTNQTFGYKLVGYYRSAQDWEIDLQDSTEYNRFTRFQPEIRSSLTNEIITSDIPNYGVRSYGLTSSLVFKPNDETLLTAAGGWSIAESLLRTDQGEGYAAVPLPFAQVRAQVGGFFGQLFWTHYNGADGNLFSYSSGLTNIIKSHHLEGQLQYNVSFDQDRHSIILGGDYRLNTVSTEETVHGRWEGQDEFAIAAAYIQGMVELGGQIDLLGALRLDHFFAMEESALSPRLSLVYKPSPKHTLRATYNRAFGAPSSINLFGDYTLNATEELATRLYGGTAPLTYHQPTTHILVDGIGPSPGIGTQLNEFYELLTREIAQEEGIPQSVSDYLIDMAPNINGFSAGELLEQPLNRPALQLSRSDMFEIGYQGLFYDKIGVNLDAYYNIRNNVLSAPIVASPFLRLPNLGADLSNAILAGLDLDRLGEIGLSPNAIAKLYEDKANDLVRDPETGALYTLGVLNADQYLGGVNLPSLDASYYNIEQINYFGLDFSLKYYFTGAFFAYGNISWLSDSFFEQTDIVSESNSEEGPLKTDFSLNIPDTRLKFGVECNPQYGLNYFLAIRYQNAWESVGGFFWTGPVEAFNIVDLGFGYSFKNNWKLNCTVTNLFEENYRGFYGTPVIGRQILLKTFYHF